MYCDVLGREYGDFRNPTWHRCTVDAYAAQHPGVPSRRSIQSVAGHLVALHLLLERGLEPGYVTRVLGAAAAASATRQAPFHWLDPPSFAGSRTVLDVAATEGIAAHERMVRAWAADVWAAWSPHHRTVRDWAAALAG